MSNARNIARLLPNVSGQLPDTNLASIAANKLVGQLPGGNMPSGSIKQIYTNQTISEVDSTTTSVTNMVNVSVPMNTDLYNYFISFHSPVRKSSSVVSDGVNMFITIDGTVICTAYHRLYSTAVNSYANQDIHRWITSGYGGGSSRTVYGALAGYSTGGWSSHDNSPDATSTGSRITVWEYYK